MGTNVIAKKCRGISIKNLLNLPLNPAFIPLHTFVRALTPPLPSPASVDLPLPFRSSRRRAPPFSASVDLPLPFRSSSIAAHRHLSHPPPSSSPISSSPSRSIPPGEHLVSARHVALQPDHFLLGAIDAFNPGLRADGPCSTCCTKSSSTDEKGKFDELVEEKGVKILIEPKALMHVVGTKMDYVDDTLKAEFIFINPNSKGQCGCGESFMTTSDSKAATSSIRRET